MGGDRAPEETIAGALSAAADGIDVVLVGDEGTLSAYLRKAGAALPIVHASQTIEMHDDPARAIREKKDASVAVAARLVADGSAHGFVSAGSTGAAMAASVFSIGRIPGIARPAIASVFPTRKVVLDAGANLDAKPEQLVQFGIMGAAMAEADLGIEDPRVGLLNIGEEAGKGRDRDREAYALLDAAPINFVGNVEGRDVTGDRTDVIVTDGFTGNVLLKAAEGTAAFIVEMVSQVVRAEFPTGAPRAGSIGGAFEELRRRLDHESYGGGHLLGIKGVAVIAHGSSSRVAIANAIRMAALDAEAGLVDRITALLARYEA